MGNRLIKLRAVSAATNTPEAGAGAAQMVNIPVNGLVDGAGIAVDASENIFISDYDKHVIYKYRRGDSQSRIIAGAYGVSGSTDGQAAAARFNNPSYIAVDRRGNVWVVDSGNNLIRKIDDNGNVFTVAAIPAEVGGNQVGGICIDGGENIYLIDSTA